MKCKDKSRPWPFRPNHITNDGDKNGLLGTGIISNQHLQGIQSEICYAIKQPTTIIEFATDGTPVRTDSPLLTYAIHEACKKFRQLNLRISKDKKIIEGDLCLLCDNCHASIFWGFNENDLIIENINDIKKKTRCLNEFYNEIPNSFFNVRIVNDRLFLEYDCPILGYRELIFPIIFEKRVIGVLFVGQITLEKQYKENLIENRIRTLPDRLPGCFNTYLQQQQQQQQTPNVLAEKIYQEHITWINHNAKERIISDIRYNKIISDTIFEIRQFEDLLMEEIKHQRILYIRKNVNDEIKEFSKPYESLGGKLKIDDKMLKDIWNRVEQSMKNLANIFSLRYVLVFGIDRVIHMEKDNLRIIARAGRYYVTFSEETLKDVFVDTSKLPDMYLVCSINNNQKYLECLQGCDLNELGDFQLILVPVIYHRHSSIAFLVSYEEDNPGTANENLPDSDLDQTLQAFDTLIVSSIAAILARGAEDNAKKQLLYLGHEVGQLVTGIGWLRETYLKNARDMKVLPTNKIQDISQDLGGLIGQMNFIFDIASKMGEDKLPEVHMDDFLPFGEVLFKWKDTYRLEAEKKRLQIRVAELKPNDPWRPGMNADKFLFEQLVYNLVNNAEKYSYRGTKIVLDCKLRNLTENSSPHVLTVIDYGRSIPQGNDIYLPFYREDVEDDDGKGLGLGLYIAWLIVVIIHRGTLKHQCELISQFNVPLIKPYINRSFKGKDTVLARELEVELDKLKEYDQIVAFSDEKRTQKYKPEDITLCNEINKVTYKVTLTATIPAQER